MSEQSLSDLNIVQLEQMAANILIDMVTSNLSNKSIPPADILEWFGCYVAQTLIMGEKHMLANPDKVTKEQTQTMLGCVETLSHLLRIFDGTKNMVLADKLRQLLNSRCLSLPVEYDATYGGMLE